LKRAILYIVSLQTFFSPDKGCKIDTDVLETEGPRKLCTLNQKTKVFGPAMLPPLKENCETTSHTDIMELTQHQIGEDDSDKERKKKRNKRRILKRHKKVIVAYFFHYARIKIV
jgi:hypothetical protein